jgi:flagellar hook-length control protein FliK
MISNLSLSPLPSLTPNLPATAGAPASRRGEPAAADDSGFPKALDGASRPVRYDDRGKAGPPESKVALDGKGKAGDDLDAMKLAAAASRAFAAEAAKKAPGAGLSQAGPTAREPKAPPLADPALPEGECSAPVPGIDCEFPALPTGELPAEPVVPPTIYVPDRLPKLPPIEQGETPEIEDTAQADIRQTLPAPWAPPVLAANLPAAWGGTPADTRNERAAPRQTLPMPVAEGPGQGPVAEPPRVPSPVAASPVAPFVPGNDRNALAALGGEAVKAAAAERQDGAAAPSATPFAAVLAAVSAPAAQPTAESKPAPAPAQASLSAEPGSAGFAPQLGAQLTVWAREGVQRASLQLNPQDLGPVNVQIKLDGANAQVVLTADAAQTRAALEQALPTLAGTLREAGLVLTGGGVFDGSGQAGAASQQAAQDGRQAAESRRLNAAGAGRDGGDDTIAAAAPPELPRRRGVVDLIA